MRAYRFDGWELNLNARRLASRDLRHITLTNGEFNLLVALLRAGGRPLSRMQLLQLSRPARREDSAAPRGILTMRGAGYRFGVPVEPVY